MTISRAPTARNRLLAMAFGPALLASATTASPATAQSLRAGEVTASDTAVGRVMEAPVNTRPLKDKFWWSDDWFDKGILPVPVNHEVIERQISYVNPADGTEVPAIVYRPKAPGTYPAVLFQHGRRGLDELAQRLARRMAARGFVVLAPDVYAARFIDPRPIEHLEETEGDVNAAVDVLLKLPDVSTTKICVYSHTRGGYYTLMVATKFRRQKKDIVCYVSFYPHWVNPNAGEPMQVYRYAPEVDRLEIPTLIFIGEYEQYQRRRSIETAVQQMKLAGRDVRLVIYPGVGRGFDFRPPRVRTFADDLATKDSVLRAAAFMRRHLAPWKKTGARK